jgi:hypothetical protein
MKTYNLAVKLLGALAILTLAACTHTSYPETAPLVQPDVISANELSEYWRLDIQDLNGLVLDITDIPEGEGQVTLRYLIDADGNVSDITVEESISDGRWEEYAISQIRQLHYKQVNPDAELKPMYVISTMRFTEP